MRLHRLIAILLLVESRGRITAQALAEALETSVRSIYRDIDVLGEAGIPLTAVSGPGGGISLMPGYTVNLRQLHGEEVLQLYLTGMGIRTREPGESGLKLKNALMKLEKTLPPAYQADLHKVQSRFLFDEAPWWEELPELPCLETLRGALLRSAKLAIRYRKVNNEVSERTVQPYGLIVKRGEWYLAAYCEAARELRTFKCERINAVAELDEGFEIPDGFSLEEYWRGQEHVFKAARREAEHYLVVIRLSREDGKQMLAQTSMEVTEVKEEGLRMLFSVNMYEYHQACKEALTLPPTAEILQPAELRAYMQQRIRQWAELYSVK
ncbi:helix-turn-helix transcriptional regulator [Paenibacillus tepidiphilus]|uniref:helix-turn-helix transcriptional regulator n=1 Tax=Paenibacillus tepidiphilus TaxID=2608683 RepID=UPI001238E5FB|nr:YafY family protein [Paenibacillus tepidiphilus]